MTRSLSQSCTLKVACTISVTGSGSGLILYNIASGSVPTGMNFVNSGTISGTPTRAGVYTVRISALNLVTTTYATFTITVS